MAEEKTITELVNDLYEIDNRIYTSKWNKCVCGKCRRNAFRVSDFTRSIS